MLIIGLIFFALCLAISNMLDTAGLAFVGGGVFGSLLYSFGADVASAFRIAVTGRGTIESLKMSLSVFERGKTFAMMWGVCGTLIGLVFMLMHIDDPSALGPAVALSFSTIMAGVLLAFGVFYPIVISLNRRIAELNLEMGQTTNSSST